MGSHYPSFRGLVPANRASSKSKRSNRSENARHEVKLRSALHCMGFRFRKNLKSLPGKPDIVFPRAKVAVFCDGDFWHGRDWNNLRAKLEKGSNSKYWIDKIEANIRRDKEINDLLIKTGWNVIRVWETDIHSDLIKITIEITNIVRNRLAAL